MKTKKIEKQFELLHSVARILAESLDLKVTMDSILHLLSKYTQMNRGTITLLDPETETIAIEVGYGLTSEAKAKGRYKIGEGITGKVVETGEPVVVPDVGKDPRFLDRTRSRGDITKKKISFICVPIKIEGNTIGALSVDKRFSDRSRVEEDVRFLNIIASVIAQAAKLNQLIKQEKKVLLKENIDLREQIKERYQIENMVGNSGVMRHLYAQIQQVAKSNTTVLILGESGTGKELVANALHYSSLRANKPLIKVNCGALPENLLESELFGHEKGAFTGADKMKEGRFEWAAGGTIFLDEIGEFSPSMQVKLLRVLQAKEFERVGGKRTIKVDVRVLAATNKNLEEEVQKGNFREDLYYRINVFPVFVPPLRERKDDIILLADYFLEKYSKDNNKLINRISTPAIDMLMSYHWPGNVRELENAIERAVLVCNEHVIRAQHLPPSLQTAEQTKTGYQRGLLAAVEDLEREMIIEALKAANGHQGRAAENLALSDRILGYKIKKYNITPRLFKKYK